MDSRKGHLARRVTTISPTSHLPQGGRCENSKNFGPIDHWGSRKGHLAPNSNSDGLKKIQRNSKNFGPIDQIGSSKGNLAPNSNSDGLKKILRKSKNFGPIDPMGSRKGHLAP